MGVLKLTLQFNPVKTLISNKKGATRACCTFTWTSKQTRDLIRDTQRYHLKPPQFNFFRLLHLAHGIPVPHFARISTLRTFAASLATLLPDCLLCWWVSVKMEVGEAKKIPTTFIQRKIEKKIPAHNMGLVYPQKTEVCKGNFCLSSISTLGKESSGLSVFNYIAFCVRCNVCILVRKNFN